MNKLFEIKKLSDKPDYHAPDTSEIRELHTFEEGGLCHCILPAGKVSKAVKHKTVSEIWYCISGKGMIWQKNDSGSFEEEFSTGHSFKIPVNNHFQFKNIGDEPLCLIISTMPKWVGSEEAIDVEGKWQLQ
jgi:mannose-6-phosphate isomerase-like protein (cupin superfamily)